MLDNVVGIEPDMQLLFKMRVCKDVIDPILDVIWPRNPFDDKSKYFSDFMLPMDVGMVVLNLFLLKSRVAKLLSCTNEFGKTPDNELLARLNLVAAVIPPRLLGIVPFIRLKDASKEITLFNPPIAGKYY